MRRLGLITGMMVAGAIGASADTYPRQPGVAIDRYAFAITLTDANNEIQMAETVDLHATAAGVSAIEFDLCGTGPRTPGPVADPCVGARRGGGGASPGGGGLSGSANEPAAPTGMTVTAVTSDGKPLQFTHKSDRLHVTLAQAPTAGGRVSIQIAYHGVPSTGLQIGNNKHGDREFFSNDWPQLARNWLAVIDHPSMKAPDSMTVIAPRHYQVISNGRLVEETDLENDQRRTAWRTDVPIPTWQYSLGVAPFAVAQFGEFRGIPMSAWVYPQEREDGFKGFGDNTRPILEYFSDHIGPYSYEKIAQVEANTVGGGMELASDIFYGYNGVPGRQLIAHEMAHQWFGDSATERDWDDVWLSEGFATYFALLYQEHEDSRDAFLRGVKSSAAQAMRYAASNPDSTIVHKNLSDVSKVIANSAQIYQGGAQVLHMLRGVVGDDRFWSGIRLYYSRFRNSNASSTDFRHAIEDACKDAGNCPAEMQDLGWFFDQWLNRGGTLQVTGSWKYDAAAKAVTITIDQTQPGAAYRMPIEIGLTLPPPPPAPAASPAAPGGRRGGGPGAAPPPPTRIVIADKHGTFTIPAASEPTSVTLDPNSWVTMMQATFNKQ